VNPLEESLRLPERPRRMMPLDRTGAFTLGCVAVGLALSP
jgi:hypothetical protein